MCSTFCNYLITAAKLDVTDSILLHFEIAQDRLKRQNGGRQRPMLSIMNDVDVLRQRLLKNVLAREFEKKKQANLDLMNTIGKRRKRNTNSSAPSPVEQVLE